MECRLVYTLAQRFGLRRGIRQTRRIPVLKARMNADLHMADDLKNTGKGNLFVIFGEPDVSGVSPVSEFMDDLVSSPAQSHREALPTEEPI